VLSIRHLDGQMRPNVDVPREPLIVCAPKRRLASPRPEGCARAPAVAGQRDSRRRCASFIRRLIDPPPSRGVSQKPGLLDRQDTPADRAAAGRRISAFPFRGDGRWSRCGAVRLVDRRVRPNVDVPRETTDLRSRHRAARLLDRQSDGATYPRRGWQRRPPPRPAGLTRRSSSGRCQRSSAFPFGEVVGGVDSAL
jgi:hypothetical protein